MNDFLDVLGRRILAASAVMGNFTLLIRASFYWLFRSRLEMRQTIIQMAKIGADSLPVTVMTSFFTGMVLALQTGISSQRLFNEPLFVGTVVSFSMVMELSPVLTALVVAGRAGAAIAAELGTMRVTEQVDALLTLGTDPVRYLVIPRFLAFMLVLPILTVMSDFSGTAGGLVVSVMRFGIPENTYWHDIIDYMETKHFYHGVIKSAVFAFAISFICSYRGLSTTGGAEGVGRSTTGAVVASMVAVLLLDYFASSVLVAMGIP
jgi:phospholipid/cholesterol/gamma-HCH transport system permease protein